MSLVNVEARDHVLYIGLNKSSRLARLQGHNAAKQPLFPELRPVMASEDVRAFSPFPSATMPSSRGFDGLHAGRLRAGLNMLR